MYKAESNRGSWHMAACTHREATSSLLHHLQLSGKSPDDKCKEGSQVTGTTLSTSMVANAGKMHIGTSPTSVYARFTVPTAGRISANLTLLSLPNVKLARMRTYLL